MSKVPVQDTYASMPDIEKRVGIEALIPTRLATKIRDKTPILTPICEHGRGIHACTNNATIKYKITNKPIHVCDLHGFHKTWANVIENDYDWEWIHTNQSNQNERDPPTDPSEYTTDTKHCPKDNCNTHVHDTTALIIHLQNKHEYTLDDATRLTTQTRTD